MHKRLTWLLTVVLLQGCAAAFVAGAAAGGLVVYDKRPVEVIKTDLANNQDIANTIYDDKDFKNSHIVVSSFHQNVLLVGQTPNARLREKAGAIARREGKVKSVYNQITIDNPTSTLTRTSDSWITTKVKSKMLATKHLRSGQIKVVTENGVVYLMGIVSRKQASLATDAARRVKGVQKVVKVFQYINLVNS